MLIVVLPHKRTVFAFFQQFTFSLAQMGVAMNSSSSVVTFVSLRLS